MIYSAAFLPLSASAHSVGFDRGFTATLHFAPDDNPVAGPESDMRFIDIKEQTGKFEPNRCECRTAIYKDGRLLEELTLKGLGPDLAARYTFPTTGEYSIKLTGRPRYESDFQPFEIDYPLRIEHSVRTDSKTADFLAIAALAGLLAGLAIAVRRVQPRKIS